MFIRTFSLQVIQLLFDMLLSYDWNMFERKNISESRKQND